MSHWSAVHVPDEVVSLVAYVDAGVLVAGDVHLAAWVARASGVADPRVALGVAMATWASRHGHACAVLSEVSMAVARERADGAERAERADGAASGASEPAPVLWPDAAEWGSALRAADPVVRVVEAWDPDPVFDPRPLVLHGARLYLQRHWVDECIVAASLATRASASLTMAPEAVPIAPGAVALLDELLPATHAEGAVNLQRTAAERVLGHRLALIVGGPGTGKTYTVARLLAVLIADAQERGTELRIALAAPTGKAAARLQEAITAAISDGGGTIPEPVRVALGALVPTTIHRLLGPLPTRRHRFDHHATNQLPHDVVVIDETSMVSLPLLARLVDALRPEARFVLVGDPDQLESVDLGAVLTDLVAAGTASSSRLPGSVVRLARGHRFGARSPIALLADSVREGREDEALAQLRAGASGDAEGGEVRFVETDDPLGAESMAAVEALVAPELAALVDAARSGRVDDALAHLSRSRVLCAHRLGPHGVAMWNRQGERWLTGSAGPPPRWYVGRPLLITRNDPRLGLVNGDTGVVVVENGRLVAVFRAAGGLVRWEPAQLEFADTAYAMTVHKSQGSEYPAVAVVLPPVTSPLVGRELVYTAVTRTKERLLVVGTQEAVRLAVRTPARRMTGLADALIRTPGGGDDR